MNTRTMLLDNLTLFLRIVEKGGLAAAGREIGLAPATVSERLAALEAHYGARLLVRTTRSLGLTDEGKALVEGARRLLAETEDLESRIRFGATRISGPIRVSAPVDLGRNRIAGWLDAFMAQYPDISIDLLLTDRYVDLVNRGIDLAVRFGALGDSTLRVRKLAGNHRFVCAAPSYLTAKGTPRHPDELARHNCILMRFGENADREWRFVVDGAETRIAVRGNRIANDGELVRAWCRAGFGIALKSQWDVAEDLKSGALVTLLTAFLPSPSALQIVYPAGSTQPRRVRILMDYLTERFRQDEISLDQA